MKTHLGLALILSVILAGCAAPIEPADSAKAAPSGFSLLKEGQTVAQVRELVGEPAEVRPLHVPGATVPGEIWIYHRTVSESIRLVPISSREIPLLNPRTGQMGTTLEPIYEPQTLKAGETIELLIVDQRLVAGKIRRESESRINPR